MKRIILFEIFIITIFNIIVNNHTAVFSFLVAILIFIGMYAFRVYDVLEMKNIDNQIVRVALGTIVGFVFIAMAEFMLLLFFYPTYRRHIIKFLLTSNFFLNVIIIPVFHKYIYNFKLKKSDIQNYLVIGDDFSLRKILNEIERKSFGKIKFEKKISIEKIKNKKDLMSLFENYSNIIISSVDESQNIISMLEDIECDDLKIDYLPNIAEQYLKRIPIEVIEKNEYYYRVIFQNVINSPEKRLLDISISVIAIIALSPIMLLLSIIIIIEDKHPFVFTQDRIGQNGKKFTIHKFRSLKIKRKKETKYATEELQRQLFVGKIIRPIRLDEILQFFDILKGKMSFVGPRPEQIDFVDRYNESIPFYNFRHRLKPGLTGWAQIMYQYASNLEETKMKLSYDLFYVKNRDFIFDLQIIMKTIEAVIWKRGAV